VYNAVLISNFCTASLQCAVFHREEAVHIAASAALHWAIRDASVIERGITKKIVSIKSEAYLGSESAAPISAALQKVTHCKQVIHL
jgi:hypothetical protein